MSSLGACMREKFSYKLSQYKNIKFEKQILSISDSLCFQDFIEMCDFFPKIFDLTRIV